MFFKCADHLLTYMTQRSAKVSSCLRHCTDLDTITIVTKFKYNTINMSVSCPPLRLLCDFILNTLTPRDSSLQTVQVL